jgi:hypothetical protein
MDDRRDPDERAKLGFRTYADDTLRETEDRDRHGAARPADPNNPWGGGLQVTYDAAPAAKPISQAPRPSRLGPAVAVGGLVCAALIGLLLARPDDRPAAGRPRAEAAHRVLPAEVLSPDAAGPAVTSSSEAATEDGAPDKPPLAAVARRPGPAAVTARVEAEAQPDAARRGSGPGEGVDPAASAQPVRVFVHIADRAQQPTADNIREQLRGLRAADRTVATPAVRFVAHSPRTTQVRCLKKADCPAAAEVARFVARRLGTPVPVVDMSSTYEADAGVRAGSLELWLRP